MTLKNTREAKVRGMWQCNLISCKSTTSPMGTQTGNTMYSMSENKSASEMGAKTIYARSSERASAAHKASEVG